MTSTGLDTRLEGIGWAGNFGGGWLMEGEGEVAGLPFYFRANCHGWNLSVATAGKEAVLADRFYYSEDWPSDALPGIDDSMSMPEAKMLMDKAVAAFLMREAK